MAFRVLVDPIALAEAEDSFRWMRRRAPQEAARWFVNLWRAIESLQVMPTRCSLAPEALALRRSVRQLLFGKAPHVYRVLFVIVNDEVRVLRIRHGARKGLGWHDAGQTPQL
jgi:plasmid stabilization system protein ParE